MWSRSTSFESCRVSSVIYFVSLGLQHVNGVLQIPEVDIFIHFGLSDLKYNKFGCIAEYKNFVYFSLLLLQNFLPFLQLTLAQAAGCLNGHIDRVTVLSVHTLLKKFDSLSAAVRAQFLIPRLNQENQFLKDV